jgi:hypothetical protein
MSRSPTAFDAPAASRLNAPSIGFAGARHGGPPKGPILRSGCGGRLTNAAAELFPPGATVLDLGSGPGEPSTRILREAGLTAREPRLVNDQRADAGTAPEHGGELRPSIVFSQSLILKDE